jgi:hypothetical protein
MDADGNGIAEAIYAVQGPIGTVGEVHRFEITSTSPFAYEDVDPLIDFPGPWFIATPKVVSSVPNPQPDPRPTQPITVWTNPVNPYDVSNEGFVSPLDMLMTINHINSNPGEFSLPARQFSPPRFLDTNVDGLITAGDVLLVLNLLNSSLAGSGEGEVSEPAGEADAAFRAWDLVVSPAVPYRASWTPEAERDQVLEMLDAADVPGTEWFLQKVEDESPQVPYSAQTPLDDADQFDLESVLEEITAEIGAA